LALLLCVVPLVTPADAAPDRERLLATFDALIDLSTLAHQRGAPDVYALTDTLARGFPRPYRTAMPYRSPPRPCSTGEHRVAVVRYTLIDPTRGGAEVELQGSALHEVRDHGAAFPKDVAEFLGKTTPSYGRFPRDVTAVKASEGEAKGWKRPTDLLFAFAGMVVRNGGSVEASAVLQNPTAAAMTVLVAQASGAGPLTVEVGGGERAGAAKVSSSFERITVPAYTTLFFPSHADLGQAAGKQVSLRWEFHLAGGASPHGEVALGAPPSSEIDL
jgi:hypothetical protein